MLARITNPTLKHIRIWIEFLQACLQLIACTISFNCLIKSKRNSVGSTFISVPKMISEDKKCDDEI